MWWNKELEDQKEEDSTKEIRNVIYIYLNDNTTISFTYTGKDKRKLSPWMGFYKWYLCREQSDVYVFDYDKGSKIVPRTLIKYFEIKLEEH